MKSAVKSFLMGLIVLLALEQQDAAAAYATWIKSSPRSAQNILPDIAMTSDGTKMVLASWNDGVYISSDGGSTWSKKSPAGSGVSKGWNSCDISQDGTKIIVGAWNDYIYTSSDSGSTWSKKSPAGTGVTKAWTSISSDPTGAKVTAAAFNDYIYVSADSGATWSKKTPAGSGVAKGWNSVASDATGNIIAAAAFNDYIYVSLDSGATWSKKAPAGSGVIKGWTSVALSDDGTVIVAAAFNDYLYVSTDSGATWSKKTPAGSGVLKGWNSLAMGGTGAQIVVSAENDYVYTSADKGGTWAKNNPTGASIGSPWQSVAMSGGGTKIAASADGSYVYYSVSDSIGWTVNFIAGAGGTLEGVSPQTVLNGKNCTAVTAVPNEGFEFFGWSGSVKSSDNPLIVTAVKSDMAIYANFAEPGSTPENIIPARFNRFSITHRENYSSGDSKLVESEKLKVEGTFDADFKSIMESASVGSSIAVSLGGWKPASINLSEPIAIRIGSERGHAKFAVFSSCCGKGRSQGSISFRWSGNTVKFVLRMAVKGASFGCVKPDLQISSGDFQGTLESCRLAFKGEGLPDVAECKVSYSGRVRSRATPSGEIRNWSARGIAEK